MQKNSLEIKRAQKRSLNIKNRQWENNVNKFYKESELPPSAEPRFNMPSKEYKAPQPRPSTSSIYKQNEAAFFGDNPERPSSKGSVFQRNAAHFYGYETPKPGERPFEPPNSELPSNAPKSVLAQKNVIYYISRR